MKYPNKLLVGIGTLLILLVVFSLSIKNPNVDNEMDEYIIDDLSAWIDANGDDAEYYTIKPEWDGEDLYILLMDKNNKVIKTVMVE